jgi:hypothetical protein
MRRFGDRQTLLRLHCSATAGGILPKFAQLECGLRGSDHLLAVAKIATGPIPTCRSCRAEYDDTLGRSNKQLQDRVLPGTTRHNRQGAVRKRCFCDGSKLLFPGKTAVCRVFSVLAHSSTDFSVW